MFQIFFSVFGQKPVGSNKPGSGCCGPIMGGLVVLAILILLFCVPQSCTRGAVSQIGDGNCTEICDICHTVYFCGHYLGHKKAHAVTERPKITLYAYDGPRIVFPIDTVPDHTKKQPKR